MKILVTGASGFIGSHLLAMLTAPGAMHEVSAVVRAIPRDAIPIIKWIRLDLSEANWTEFLPKENFDVVIHLAQSKHHRDFPNQLGDIFKINIQATVELAEWARKNNVARFIFASTGNVYGSRSGAHREDDICTPDNMYGASKLSAEVLLKPFSEFMDIVILRLFGIYGPGQTKAMLPEVIKRFIAGDEITLAGNIGVRFNPLYVTECVSTLVTLLTAKLLSRYEVLNVGGSEIIDLKEISMLMENYTGVKARVRLTADQPKEIVGATDKLHLLCPFIQNKPFTEGFRQTFDFVNSSSERV